MSLPSLYQAALDYIFNYVDYERRRSVPYTETAWDLERTRRVLHGLGDPHLTLRYVHVAGSKGKGSTAANVDAILRASGLRTGFYSSPHLHTFRERIRIDGQLIGQQDVVQLLAQCQPAIEAVPGITTFEIITVLALLHFAQQQVEWVVLEVGLGGRLDATNVVVPAVSVITPISLEHTALLGDTLDLIAREKAGIIKPDVPVVVAPQHAEALAAIEEVATRRGSRLVLAGRDWTWRSIADSVAGQTFDVAAAVSPWGPDELAALHTPLLGAHQLANATTAIAACAELARQGAPVTADSLRRGLAQVVWPGRLEVLAAPPLSQQTLVLDSSHNDTSARLLRSALAHYFPGRPLHLVVGVSNDKDAAGILAELLPGAQGALLTRSRHPRAADPIELAPIAARYLPADRIRVVLTAPEALTQALEQAEPDAIVCLAGSLFIAGEGREAWLAMHPGSLPAGDWAYEAEPPAPGWQVAQTPATAPAASLTA
ncbi:MAG TPA: folylpolyglutamate synthase/dihydrofolate synthase family protein [Anaerolineae bacterium]|nr:folylpolyglutamate synthase/dihydrofolate synthase family protein [Anaerolineae bacterium]